MRHLMRQIPLVDAVARRDWLGLGTTAFFGLLLVLLPLVMGFDHRLINVVLYVSIYAVLALGLNVVLGYTGLLELGYVTFLATGAIVAVDLLLLTKTDEGWTIPLKGAAGDVDGWQPFQFPGGYLLIVLVAGVVCGLLGILRGIPTLRLTGDYYAIVTLGFGEIFYLIYLNQTSWTGGAHGMSLSYETTPTLFTDDPLYYDSPQFYYLVLLFLGLTIVVMDRLNRSRVGRAWAAIRLDETAARACGINTSFYKLVGFGVSGFCGGVGGALYALWAGTIAAKSLNIWQSILILCAVVLGGMGSIRGVLVGSVILFSLREVLREDFGGFRVPPEAANLIYGLLLIFVMRFRPQGLLPRGSGESVPMTPEEEAELKAGSARLYVLQEGK